MQAGHEDDEESTIAAEDAGEASAETPSTSLGVVQRVDVAARAVALHVRAPGIGFVVVVANGRGLADATGLTGTAYLDAEARRTWPSARLPLPAMPEQARARLLLIGGHLIGLSANAAIVSKGNQVHALVPEGSGEGARVRLRAAEERDLSGPQAPADAEVLTERSAVGRTLGPKLSAWGTAGAIASLTSAIAKALVRLDKRSAAVRGDLARIGDADRLAAQASWLVAAASKAPRGATSLEVTYWSTGEPLPLVVPLDPSKPAKLQVEAMFHRARRLKKGAAVAATRLAETESQSDALRMIQLELEELTSAAAPIELATVQTLAERAKASAPRDLKLASPGEAGSGGGKKRGLQERSAPFRAFLREDGLRILVGKGAEKNDQLTFQIARPHDLWLHAKGKTGAHVIVPLSKATNVPGDVLADAALLAAHFSDARDEAVVDVEYTPRKYLKKPRGGVPGRVVIEREKVLALRVDPARRKALLEREEVA